MNSLLVYLPLVLNLFSSATCIQNHPPIEYQTLTIFNQFYLVSDDWLGLVAESGEDINSAKYGGIYFPPFTMAKQINESRTTLARKHMEVEFDLKNNTQEKYTWEYISINILEVHEASEFKATKGEWDVVSRSGSFRPELRITGNSHIITEPAEEEIWPKEDWKNSYFIVDILIDNSPNTLGKIYAFEVLLQFKDSQGKSFKLKSDKTYFIAAE